MMVLDFIWWMLTHPVQGIAVAAILLVFVGIVQHFLVRLVRRNWLAAGIWWAMVKAWKLAAALGMTGAVIVLGAINGARWAKHGMARRAFGTWWSADKDWKHLATAHKIEGGRVIAATPTPIGRRLLVALPRGLTASALDAQKAASAVGARAVTIEEGWTPGFAIVRTREGADPLATVVVPAQLDDRAINVDEALVGVTENGRPWTVPVRGKHVLLAGVTGGGKGSVLWGIIRSLAPAIRAGVVEVWAFDPKGGMELKIGRPLFARYADDDRSMLALAHAAVEEMDAQTHALAGKVRKHEPSATSPHRVILIDEVASLTAYHPDAGMRKQYQLALGTLVSKGRAPGFTVIAALQDPRKEVLSLRAMFPVRIALRLEEANQVDMVLGSGSLARGASCHLIPPSMPGAGYVRVDGSDAVTRVRAAYVDDQEIRRLARAFAPPRAHAPARADGEAVSHAPAPAREEAAPSTTGGSPPSAPVARSTRAAARDARRAEHAARQAARDEAARRARSRS